MRGRSHEELIFNLFLMRSFPFKALAVAVPETDVSSLALFGGTALIFVDI